jgi:putative DNA primase/helicase
MARRKGDGKPPDEVAEAMERHGGKTKPKKPKGTGWLSKLVYDKNHEKVRVVDSNLLLIFRNDPEWAGALAYDERSLTVVWTRESKICKAAAGDEFKEAHSVEVVLWLAESVYAMLARRVQVYESMIASAYEHTFDPVRQWVESLEWDGVARLDRWLPDAVGCDANAYTMEAGAKWLISAIARALRPGCKVDTMLILCGPQGSLKSSMLAELGGTWFTDQIGEIGNRDTLLQICGPWLVEMSELDSKSKRETTAVKAFLSTTTDRFRRPYGRDIEQHPRRCVFAGTTNQETFLKDDTGGRRFWPIKIEEIDLEFVKANRLQLFAEATFRYLAGEKWWLSLGDEAAELAAEEQERRRRIDPWQEKILGWLEGIISGSLSTNAILDGIGIETARQDHSAAIRVGQIMALTNWRRRRKRLHGSLVWMYEHPIHPVGDEHDDATTAPTVPEQSFGDRY